MLDSLRLTFFFFQRQPKTESDSAIASCLEDSGIESNTGFFTLNCLLLLQAGFYPLNQVVRCSLSREIRQKYVHASARILPLKHTVYHTVHAGEIVEVTNSIICIVISPTKWNRFSKFSFCGPQLNFSLLFRACQQLVTRWWHVRTCLTDLLPLAAISIRYFSPLTGCH